MRGEAEIKKEIAELEFMLERGPGILTQAYIEGQLKALYWLLGCSHLEAYDKAKNRAVYPPPTIQESTIFTIPMTGQ